MDRKLDGRFLLEGGANNSVLSYWHHFDEVDVFPTYEEFNDEEVLGVKLSIVMTEWYEQVYKPGNSSVKFVRNP